MISVKCENCGVDLQVTDDKAGRNGKCPKCGGRFVVPTPSAQKIHCVTDRTLPAAESAKNLIAPPATPAIPVPAPPGRSKIRLVLAILIIAALSGEAVWGTWIYFSRSFGRPIAKHEVASRPLGEAITPTTVVAPPDVVAISDENDMKQPAASEPTVSESTTTLSAEPNGLDGKSLTSNLPDVPPITAASSGLVRTFGLPVANPTFAFSRDGTRVATFDFTGMDKCHIRFYAVERGTADGTMDVPWYVNTLAFSPDSKLLVCSHLSGSATSVTIIDVRTCKVISTREIASGDESAKALFTPDGQSLVTGCKVMKILDLASNRQIHLLSTDNRKSARYDNGFECAFSADGSKALTADSGGHLLWWDMTEGKLLNEVDKGTYTFRSHWVLLPDGRQALVSGSGGLQVIDLETGRTIQSIPRVTAKAFIDTSRDGRQATILTGDKTIQTFDLETGRPVGSMKGPEAYLQMAVASSARRLAYVDGKELYIWQVPPTLPPLPVTPPETPTARGTRNLTSTISEAVAKGPPSVPAAGASLVVLVSPALGLTPEDVADALGLDDSYVVVAAENTPLRTKAHWFLQINLKSVNLVDNSMKDDASSRSHTWKEADVELIYKLMVRPGLDMPAVPAAPVIISHHETPIQQVIDPNARTAFNPVTLYDRWGQVILTAGDFKVTHYKLFTWTPAMLRRIATTEALAKIRSDIRYGTAENLRKDQPLAGNGWRPSLFEGKRLAPASGSRRADEGYAPSAVRRVDELIELEFPLSNSLPLPVRAKVTIRVPSPSPRGIAYARQDVSLSGYERTVLTVHVPVKDCISADHPEPDMKQIFEGTRASAEGTRASAFADSRTRVGFGQDDEAYAHQSIAALTHELRSIEWGIGGDARRRPQTEEELAKALLLQMLRRAEKVKPANAAVPPVERSPEDQAAANLQFARSYLANGLKSQAGKLLEEIVKDFPDTKAAEQAQKELQNISEPTTLPGK